MVKTAEYGKEKGFSVRIEQLEIDKLNNLLEFIKLTNNLSPSKLIEYDWRIKVFLNKFGNETPFEFVSGPKKSLVYSPQVAKLISQKRIDKLQGKIFLGRNKKTYAISDLKLTKEFQDYEGFSTEAKEIKSTVGQLQKAKSELASAIVPIRVHSNIYNVIGIEKTPGSPKSDFHFVDDMQREIVWISHKDGKRPIDFQQWSGMTEKELWKIRKSKILLHLLN